MTDPDPLLTHKEVCKRLGCGHALAFPMEA